MSQTFDTPARIDLERTAENLFAHVELDVMVGPGDRYLVQGPPIRLRFGERKQLVRVATVRRASPLRRLLTRLAGHFALTELYEVSFSGRRLL